MSEQIIAALIGGAFALIAAIAAVVVANRLSSVVVEKSNGEQVQFGQHDIRQAINAIQKAEYHLGNSVVTLEDWLRACLPLVVEDSSPVWVLDRSLLAMPMLEKEISRQPDGKIGSENYARFDFVNDAVRQDLISFNILHEIHLPNAVGDGAQDTKLRWPMTDFGKAVVRTMRK